MQAITILGSNQGDRRQSIHEAIRQLSATNRLVLLSSCYETAPWGFKSTEPFLNQVAVFETHLSPLDFLHHCLNVEKALGRIRLENSPRYTSRPIDIDMLFYGSTVMETPELILPHPRLHLRNFVLVPLAEILPQWEHPVLHKNMAELLADCPDRLEVKKL